MNAVLNVYASKLFHIDAGVPPKGSIFLIFINDLPDAISSQLSIYADRTIICTSFYCKADGFHKVKLAAALENELQLGTLTSII